MNLETLGIIALVIVGAIFASVLVVGGFLVVRDTIRQQGKWGLNFKPLFCPCCGEPAPAVRVPTSFREALWGGCTCSQCGARYDKWGTAVLKENLPVVQLSARPRKLTQSAQLKLFMVVVLVAVFVGGIASLFVLYFYDKVADFFAR